MTESNGKNKLALFFRWAARLTGIAIGGLFLLFKATMELHERLEGQHSQTRTKRVYPRSAWC